MHCRQWPPRPERRLKLPFPRLEEAELADAAPVMETGIFFLSLNVNEVNV